MKQEYGHIVCMVSRRAAGVWTNLPSISYSLLAKAISPGRILWVDLGLRYEMFNHFRINPLTFPESSCILGLLNFAHSNRIITADDLITYTQAVSGYHTDTNQDMLPISNIKGNDAKQYREYIRKLSSKGYDIFMVPLQVPSLNISETGVSLSTTMIKDLVINLVKKVRPIYTFVTLEGQPEARIFARKIAEDQSLSQWLNASDMILAMVRFDSEERFNDSVSIPAIISRNTTWRKRLKLVLTRVSAEPRITNELEEYLLGFIPFADFIGESVNSGRIPLVNIWCRDGEAEIGSDINKYLKCIDSMTERIKTLLIPCSTLQK